MRMNMTATKIQKALRGLGLYLGKIDGRLGAKSIAAISKFQRINPPLSVDGIAGANTLAELFIEPFKTDDAVIQNGNVTSIYPKQDDVHEYYGRVGNKADQTRVILPYPMPLAWDLEQSITRFSCHKKIVEPLQKIFEDALSHYGLAEIQRLRLNLFGGCLNVRKIRGGDDFSMHSWGIAVDIDPANNKLRWGKDKATLAGSEYNAWWDIVEFHGAISLGRRHNFDWMHFQFTS